MANSKFGRAIHSTFRGTGKVAGAAADFFVKPGTGESLRWAGEKVGWVAGFAGDAGLAAARAASRRTRDRRVRSLVESIEAAEEAHDYHRLLELAREYAQRAPEQPMGPAWQAMALARMEDYDEALLATERAERLGLPESTGQALRAEILARRGQPRTADSDPGE